MSFATKCICDGCGRIKGDANKWLIGYEFDFYVTGEGVRQFFGVRHWDDSAAKGIDVLHLCGSACMQKKLAEFLASQEVPEVEDVSADAEAQPMSELTYEPVACAGDEG